MSTDHIESIIVEYGGYHDGTEIRKITHDGDEIVVERRFYNGASDDGKVLYDRMTWSSFLEAIESLHIDTWDEEYDNPDVLDGSQWSLDLEYSNNVKGKHYRGSNMYPENFDDFLRVIEM